MRPLASPSHHCPTPPCPATPPDGAARVAGPAAQGPRLCAGGGPQPAAAAGDVQGGGGGGPGRVAVQAPVRRAPAGEGGRGGGGGEGGAGRGRGGVGSRGVEGVRAGGRGGYHLACCLGLLRRVICEQYARVPPLRTNDCCSAWPSLSPLAGGGHAAGAVPHGRRHHGPAKRAHLRRCAALRHGWVHTWGSLCMGGGLAPVWPKHSAAFAWCLALGLRGAWLWAPAGQPATPPDCRLPPLFVLAPADSVAQAALELPKGAVGMVAGLPPWLQAALDPHRRVLFLDTAAVEGTRESGVAGWGRVGRWRLRGRWAVLACSLGLRLCFCRPFSNRHILPLSPPAPCPASQWWRLGQQPRRGAAGAALPAGRRRRGCGAGAAGRHLALPRPGVLAMPVLELAVYSS